MPLKEPRALWVITLVKFLGTPNNEGFPLFSRGRCSLERSPPSYFRVITLVKFLGTLVPWGSPKYLKKVRVIIRCGAKLKGASRMLTRIKILFGCFVSSMQSIIIQTEK
jgi:hypothetical protein